MKFIKALAITLLSLLLTGCYTQLQHSQTMKKITDEQPVDKAGVYAQEGTENEEQSPKEKQADKEYAEYQDEDEEHIPIYYKDYEYATKYGDVYNIKNYYGNDWYGYNSYYPYSSFRSYHSWRPFYFDRWHHHSFFGYGYHRPAFAMSFSIGWGGRYSYHRYYDPFFDPYYDFYWRGYHSPFAYNYGYFYGKSGYGHGYYPDKKARQDDNTRYGPRSIGTNRVATDSNRSRTNVNGRTATVSNSASSEVRTRSTGTLRTRSSDGNTSVRKAKTDSNSSSTTRVRSRSSNRVAESDYRDSSIIKRSRENTMPIVVDEDQLKQLRSRTNSSSNRTIINRTQLGNDREEKPTFFNRMKNFIQDGSSRISNGTKSRTVRSRGTTQSSNRSKINRSSTKNRSSVTKSKSSSNNSRSRGSSSSSRSRSDNGSSSSNSDRSRGN